MIIQRGEKTLSLFDVERMFILHPTVQKKVFLFWDNPRTSIFYRKPIPYNGSTFLEEISFTL